MQIVDECVSDGKVAALGVSSMSAWLLLANVANDCGDKNGGEMTKACVLEEAAAVKDWTGGGPHAPSDPSPEAGSSGNCGLQWASRDSNPRHLPCKGHPSPGTGQAESAVHIGIAGICHECC